MDLEHLPDPSWHDLVYAHLSFFGKITYTDPTSCWPWGGSVNSEGYPRYRPSVDGKTEAHSPQQYMVNLIRKELGRDLLTPGTRIHHACKNRLCMNPRHFIYDTTEDRAARRCRSGHFPLNRWCKDCKEKRWESVRGTLDEELKRFRDPEEAKRYNERRRPQRLEAVRRWGRELGFPTPAELAVLTKGWRMNLDGTPHVDEKK